MCRRNDRRRRRLAPQSDDAESGARVVSKMLGPTLLPQREAGEYYMTVVAGTTSVG